MYINISLELHTTYAAQLNILRTEQSVYPHVSYQITDLTPIMVKLPKNPPAPKSPGPIPALRQAEDKPNKL
ncbi:hypothetical protein N7508_004260 [Penicillium antarcticum]|uniref:uncharacterized protein n=1 Tax=Penicillium antarcticum TaxID=416450 RepID=UPI0023850719|nr:uncharacterized protein N7508_004260 [Penicillium antarcticum]KAJ5308881.1 hypothetical protein N7508_004260 [Penicillium antarcticum]